MGVRRIDVPHVDRPIDGRVRRGRSHAAEKYMVRAQVAKRFVNPPVGLRQTAHLQWLIWICGLESVDTQTFGALC